MGTTTKQCPSPGKFGGGGGGWGGGFGGGPLTPTKRRAATTPRKRPNPRTPSLSPPLLRTPPKTACRQGSGSGSGVDVGRSPRFSSHYSSDRFIPNRSALRVDICRASVESAERNLGRTFEKLSRQQAERRRRGLSPGGENGDPNARGGDGGDPASSGGATPPPAPGGASPGAPSPHRREEATTPLQAEFHRRMRGALLNLPMDDQGSRYLSNSSATASAANGENERQSSHESIADTTSIHDRENVESIVYASLNDDDPTIAGGSPHPPVRGVQRMLSFQGTRQEDVSHSAASSYRSASSSSLDDGTNDGKGTIAPGGRSTPLSTPLSTPRRRLARQASGSSRCLSPLPSPHCLRQASPRHHHRLASSAASVDPFSHDQLHVLHRAASNSGGAPGGGGAGSSARFVDSLSQAEERLRTATKSIGRRIPKAPSRILDAPELVDDYYLNLVSWSESNVLAVALGQCVYLWEADTGNIRHLLTLREETDFVTSVAWVRDKGNSHYIAVGTNHNVVQLWDAAAERRLRTLDGHTARVGALSWNQHWLSSGGRDSRIVQHDVRSRDHVVSTYVGHTQEVCGLKWNDEGSTLASGGNENLLCLWDASMSRRGGPGGRGGGAAGRDLSALGPRLALSHHKAAVKALAWCPFRRGLLASGGGTADRTIKFWNANSGAVLNSIDTGSQVCSLLWSKHQREICSSHGFSENQLILWKYPTMTKIQEFKGHTARVLHMDQSPDGGCVVSAAADETLRFWDVFGSPPSERKGNDLAMGNFGSGAMIR
ncbi:hypothetical protein ACHAWF_010327 [Thalassiosira exigua]